MIPLYGDVMSPTRRSAHGLDSPHNPPDAWKSKGLCAQTDPEAFFPEKGGSTRDAKRICVGCEVRTECLDHAVEHDERFGIWGGLSERERRRLKNGDTSVLLKLTDPGQYSKCEVCGTTLYATGGHAPARFCSESCRWKRRDQGDYKHGELAGYKAGCKCVPCCDANARWVDEHRGEPDPRDCRQCGKTFTPGHGSARYCTVQCRRKAEYVRQHRPDPAVHTHECGTCAGTFIGHHRARYCSNECRDTARRNRVKAAA